MSDLTIITNGHYRPVLCWEELTKKERSDYDWGWAVEDSYFRYKKQAYSLGEFMRVTREELKDWDGVMGDSYFSGMLLKFSNCGDAVRVGRYYC